jgi:hypothetical protein
VRKYLLTFIRLFQNNKFAFEGAPGTVAQSTEWGQFHHYLTSFGVDRMVGGVYGKFDKRMLAQLILAAFDFIKNILRAAGWPDEDLMIISCIAHDIAFPLSDYNGDLVEFWGSNPSGHPLTVIINSIVNPLYMRYCFALLSQGKTFADCVPAKFLSTFCDLPEAEHPIVRIAKFTPNELVTTKYFKLFVHLMTYGDDNVFGVSRFADWFNHTSIQATLAEIGVVYTMADKTAESIPFIHIDDISFLKRSWRWDNEVEAYLCPIEEDTIAKMLTTHIPSKTICGEEQCTAVIESALQEYWFYGREVFDKRRKQLQEVFKREIHPAYEKNSTFLTWEQFYERFWTASGKPGRKYGLPDFS